MSANLDQIALDAATNIMKLYFDPIPGVQLKAKIQEVVRDAMGRAEQPSNPVPHADTVDAERWRRWMPWMRNLNKLPFNLAKELAEIEQAEARIVGQQTNGGSQ